jgi:acyl-coenzyme A thioesterase PaaI-like protein
MRRRSGPFWDGVEGGHRSRRRRRRWASSQFQSTLQLNVGFLRPFDRAGSSKGRVVQRDGDLAFLEASLLDGDAAVIATATRPSGRMDRPSSR